MILSPDLKREELIGALNSADPAESLRSLEQRGTLFEIIPELIITKGAEQPPEHFWDVLNHLIETVGSIDDVLADPILLSTKFPLSVYMEEIPCDHLSHLTILKMAALFHDIAKPQTMTREPSGKYRFFGHPEMGADISRLALTRLNFPQCEIEMVAVEVYHHLRPGVLSAGRIPSDRALLRYFRDLNDVGVDTLLLNLADHRAMRGPLLLEKEWIDHLDEVRLILDRHYDTLHRRKLPKLISGNDLIKEFGLQPGPKIGQVLTIVRESQVSGMIRTREEALALVMRVLGRS